jgi:hypothetical protein
MLTRLETDRHEKPHVPHDDVIPRSSSPARSRYFNSSAFHIFHLRHQGASTKHLPKLWAVFSYVLCIYKPNTWDLTRSSRGTLPTHHHAFLPFFRPTANRSKQEATATILAGCSGHAHI